MRRTSPHSQIVCGVDEAGRGPWAGPVVVAAVVLNRARPIAGLDDSKVLSAATRELLFDEIAHHALAVSCVMVGCERIARLNIRGATLWGMARAVRTLAVPPTAALFDGCDVPPGLGAVKGRALVDGDARSASIAAASIVAKVTRDRLMVRVGEAFPAYGFERHKGYGTPEHRAALAVHGPCIHHRKGWAPVRAADRTTDAALEAAE